MPEPDATNQPGDILTVEIGHGPRGPVEMTFCYIPPCLDGFWMGSRDGRGTERPAIRVVIPYGFWLGRTPVTQEQFEVWTDSADYRKKFSEAHKNWFSGNPDCPAETVTWRQANAYCRWLGAELSNRGSYPSGMGAARLPYEAEWEYACRAGTTTDYYAGDGAAALREVGRFAGNSERRTWPVGQLKANAWGLCDMHGNVWEWCADRWDANSYRRCWDGITPHEMYLLNERYGNQGDASSSGESRVLRGGAWLDPAAGCRAAARDWLRAADSCWWSGLRACLVPSPIKSGSQSSS